MYELTYYYYQPNIKTNIAIQGGKPTEKKMFSIQQKVQNTNMRLAQQSLQ